MKITTLRNVSSLPPLFDSNHSKSLKLFRHIKKSSASLTKLCLEGKVTRERNRDKPKQSWRDNVIMWLQPNEMQTKHAQDHNKCQEISYVHNQM